MTEALMTWLDYLDAHQPRFVDELLDFVRIPSVSASDANKAAVVRAGDWVVARLIAAGAENARMLPTAGHPVVYADWLHAGADKPTIVIYGHFMGSRRNPSTFGTPRPSIRWCAMAGSMAGARRTTRAACLFQSSPPRRC